jgi:hypothetical protein
MGLPAALASAFDRAVQGISSESGRIALLIWLLGICFHARRTGNGQNGGGYRGVRGLAVRSAAAGPGEGVVGQCEGIEDRIVRVIDRGDQVGRHARRDAEGVERRADARAFDLGLRGIREGDREGDRDGEREERPFVFSWIWWMGSWRPTRLAHASRFLQKRHGNFTDTNAENA